MKKPYHFTWGNDHAHPNCYTTIEAETEEIARKLMVAIYDLKWCGCYTEEEKPRCIDRWNLRFIQFPYVAVTT